MVLHHPPETFVAVMVLDGVLERFPACAVAASSRVWFTPFPTEPVGWLIEQSGDDLVLFSSDYPRPEGGRDPLGRFEESLEDTSDEARERFYSGNFGVDLRHELGNLSALKCSPAPFDRQSVAPTRRSGTRPVRRTRGGWLYQRWVRSRGCLHEAHAKGRRVRCG